MALPRCSTVLTSAFVATIIGLSAGVALAAPGSDRNSPNPKNHVQTTKYLGYGAPYEVYLRHRNGYGWRKAFPARSKLGRQVRGYDWDSDLRCSTYVGLAFGKKLEISKALEVVAAAVSSSPTTSVAAIGQRQAVRRGNVVFKPACLQHDFCYANGVAYLGKWKPGKRVLPNVTPRPVRAQRWFVDSDRRRCDSHWRGQMLRLCAQQKARASKNFPRQELLHRQQLRKCRADARLFYAAVRDFGGGPSVGELRRGLAKRRA